MFIIILFFLLVNEFNPSSLASIAPSLQMPYYFVIDTKRIVVIDLLFLDIYLFLFETVSDINVNCISVYRRTCTLLYSRF